MDAKPAVDADAAATTPFVQEPPMDDVRPVFKQPEDLSKQLPVMALRRGVLLPGAASPFLVGRARSVAAVDANHDGYLLVAAQREPVSSPAPSCPPPCSRGWSSGSAPRTAPSGSCSRASAGSP
jgi:hypothetical protein